MKLNFTKIISIAVVLSIVFSAITPVAADEMDSNPTKTEQAAAATDDMKALYALGVLNEAMLADADANVTRGDFAEITVKFSAKAVVDNPPYYKDIEGEKAAYAATSVLYGLMDDGVSGNFRSAKTISGADVAKAAVVSLGYTEMAKYFGNYQEVANKIGVCKNISSNDKITFKLLADVLMDVLKTNYAYSYINNGAVEINETDEPYIEAVLDARILRGKVTATRLTSVNGSEGVGDGHIELGGEDFLTEVNMDKYIGSTVNCIVKNSGDLHTVVYVYQKKSGKEDITISAEDISGFSNNKYTYYQDDRTRTVGIGSDRLVLYNEQHIENYTRDMFIPERGYVRLVDGDGDGVHEIVFIYSYRVMTAATPDFNNRIIADKFGEDLLTWTSDAIINVVKENKTIDISAIKKGDVLMVYQSVDGKNLKIEVSSKTIKGTLNTFSSSDKKITIDGEKYAIEPDYFSAHTDKFKYTDGSKVVNNNLFIGKQVIAYIAANGKAAFLEYGASGYELGYLINVGTSSDDLFEKILTFKIYTTGSKIQYFKAAGEKIVVDNKKINSDKAYDMLCKGTGEILSQLIQYRLDENGCITNIDTPYNNQPLSSDSTPLLERHSGEEETDSSFRITYSSYLGTNQNTLLCKNASAITFGYNINATLKKNAYAFIVPENPKSKGEENFAVYSSPQDYFKSDSFYKIETYQFDDQAFNADAILTIDDSGAGEGMPIKQQNVRAITDMCTVSRDGDIIVELNVQGNALSANTIYATDEKFWKEVPVTDPEDSNKYELEVGDIIWYDLNTQNEITNVYLVYDASEPDPDKAFKASSRADMRRRHGNIYDYPRMILYDVYEVKGSTAKVTTENLHTYTGDPTLINFEYENLDIFGDKVVHIDLTGRDVVVTASNSNWVGAASVNDIKDYVSYGRNSSRIIGVTKWGYSEVLIIINDTRDVE